MRGAALIVVLLLLAPAAFAQPACNASVPNAYACQSQAVNPQATDIVSGQQAAGPQRVNQTVKYSLQQITAGGFPGSFSTLGATGPASLLGGGTHTGTFTGGTFSGITLGGSITGTGATITGGTFSGITLSGTIPGTPTLSGNLTFSGIPTFSGASAQFNTTAIVGSNTTAQTLRLNGAAGSARVLEWASAGVKRYHIQPNGSDNLQMLAYDSGGLNPATVWTITNATGAFTFGSPPVTVPFFQNSGAGTVTYSGSDNGTCGVSEPFCANMAFAGSTATAATPSLNRFFISSDNIATPNVGAGADQFRFDMNFGGTAINGGRRGVSIVMTDTADMPSQDGTAGFVAFQPKIIVSHNASPSGPTSYIEAMNPTCQIEATAVNWGNCSVIESDMYVKAGATQPLLKSFQFWHLTPDDAQQATLTDAFLIADAAPSIGLTNTVGTMRALFQVMKLGASQWPMDATLGEFLTIGQQTQPNANSVAVRPNAMLRAFNFHNVNFVDSAMWWPGGWLGGGGEARFSRLKIGKGTNGPIIDATLYKATACAVSVGGTSYQAGDQVYPVGLAGVINIDTVAAGVVTGCSWVADREAYSTTNPATAATTGGTGNKAFVASITWALATQMSLAGSVPLFVGPIAAMTGAAGEFGMAKISDPASAPGAGVLKLTAEAGTNAGTCKLVVRAGTSATAITLQDNIGGGC